MISSRMDPIRRLLTPSLPSYQTSHSLIDSTDSVPTDVLKPSVVYAVDPNTSTTFTSSRASNDIYGSGLKSIFSFLKGHTYKCYNLVCLFLVVGAMAIASCIMGAGCIIMGILDTILFLMRLRFVVLVTLFVYISVGRNHY